MKPKPYSAGSVRESVRKRIKALLIAFLVALPFAAAFGDPLLYERALANVLVSEGYTYTNVPGDPGGPTKYGITIWDVRKYLNPKATAQDVKRLQLDDAKLIYRKHYWDAVHGDYLPAGLDYTVFDYAVNAGTGKALKDLKACGWETKPIRPLPPPKAEPQPIPETVPAPAPAPAMEPWYMRIFHYFIPAAHAEIATLNRGNDKVIATIKCVNDRRMRFQMGLPARFNKFKRGWSNRIKSVRQISIAMAGGGKADAGLYMDLYAIPRIGIGKAYDPRRE